MHESVDRTGVLKPASMVAVPGTNALCMPAVPVLQQKSQQIPPDNTERGDTAALSELVVDTPTVNSQERPSLQAFRQHADSSINEQVPEMRPFSVIQQKEALSDVSDSNGMGTSAIKAFSIQSHLTLSDPSKPVQRMDAAYISGTTGRTDMAHRITDQVDPPVVQRTVLSKIRPLKGGGTETVYYSTYDTKTEFAGHFDAWRHDTKLAKSKKATPALTDRVPTIATYYKTSSRNVVGTNKQNPHTLSHSSLAYRLGRRLKDTDRTKLRDKQVLTKKEFYDSVKKEKPAGMKEIDLARLLKDYEVLYDKLDELLRKDDQHADIPHLMMRLMSMNPYAAYGKGGKSKKSAARHIKGKGERKEDGFDDAFDKGAKFNSREGYANFTKKRKRLYSDEENSSDEESEGSQNESEDSVASAGSASGSAGSSSSSGSSSSGAGSSSSDSISEPPAKRRRFPTFEIKGWNHGPQVLPNTIIATGVGNRDIISINGQEYRVRENKSAVGKMDNDNVMGKSMSVTPLLRGG